jgi:hypothetical protein
MMTAFSFPFSKIISIEQGAREHYHIPKYQRDYTWGRGEWEKLIQDIDENDAGYFMGSIICIKESETVPPGDELLYEVVDGQQRLTTLSLLMMALFDRLSQVNHVSAFTDQDDRDRFQMTLASLRNKLVKKKKESREGERGGLPDGKHTAFCRVQPSSQNHNLEDYLYRLGKLGLIRERPKVPHAGNRQISRAFKYFRDQLPQPLSELLDLVDKINELNFVLITVNSQSDAFTLFETLNNRGVPLSAIDIIKNMMLAEMERQQKGNINESYDRWQAVIAAIPDPSSQERFLRHFYHAAKIDPKIKVDGVPRAVKSKLIHVYAALIKRDAAFIFSELISKGTLYGALLESDLEPQTELRESLEDLARVGATPAYQVLLYLGSLPLTQRLEPDLLRRAIELLARYYVRRNVTDTPPTRTLDQAHIDLIEACHESVNSKGCLAFSKFQALLLSGNGAPGTIEQFRAALAGPIYSTNVGMARYLLCKLDAMHHTREYKPDLWARDDKGKFVWTIEHVLPQKEGIPAEWVDMVADGDREMAEEIHSEQVNRLGNLTLSGYNSKLAVASLSKKQELANDRSFLGHRINIGYRNGLALNSLPFEVDGTKHSLADVPRWGAETICARTEAMVSQLVQLYRFPGEV